jgi:hypothetical protein
MILARHLRCATLAQERTLEMLPHFPKSHKQMMEIREDKIWEGFYSASPVLRQIGFRAQREGKASTFQTEQGAIEQIDYKHTGSEIVYKPKDAEGMTVQEFIKIYQEPAREMGKKTVTALYEKIDKITQQTGNFVNSGRKPLSHDLFLDLIEKMPIDFDSSDQPRMPSLNAGSEMFAHLQQQIPKWHEDPAFLTRWKAILDKKREEFREREACRRLVD